MPEGVGLQVGGILNFRTLI